MQPGEQPDIASIMQQAQQMQQQLMAAQAEISQAEVSGQAGGGLVRATVKGTGELVGLTIDPKVVDPDDVETLQDLIIGAVADASNAAQSVAAEKLGPLAGGLGGGSLGLPGF
ncbi:YbaB/EbfC family nucleoid-associated protein [Rhodococcus sp. BP-252]|uniref:Nucleoid-associated protein A3K89_19445 n=1 Tax=Rhodococcoides kyotonense TaxID=398843 RepID=A0A177YJ06_9NOCA|nr:MULTISPECIES: YbaB/EbfC family nucleoid-associated protein [Rhodococcus]NIL75302.1 Nucleoid-associated protein YbaB [Rhodococcus sp. B10]MBY6410823.1 YbaB/EbfC family nucleoid-associated protein [Rhodococcus sp. BP-320]MBY6415352.1 YbaB/EbfC family nucleoid-associated protein [Rhodococcus sp. BP-321]MBY6419967.1 YbaB/EbfC family nucleoid-associated protein [Rhodococcus sp. BP-324]MBY6425379.1 YbaB/EbfC family nucleoid-associated protein [Rhodococcus sp. BP-323]